jgi:(E)-4-hydroxy-3-methylbut-2-enyl-diphosphate synthase
MTNTPTADIEATTMQIKELANAGSELVRITVNDDKAALAVPKIVKNIRNLGMNVPIV